MCTVHTHTLHTHWEKWLWKRKSVRSKIWDQGGKKLQPTALYSIRWGIPCCFMALLFLFSLQSSGSQLNWTQLDSTVWAIYWIILLRVLAHYSCCLPSCLLACSKSSSITVDFSSKLFITAPHRTAPHRSPTLYVILTNFIGKKNSVHKESSKSQEQQ